MNSIPSKTCPQCKTTKVAAEFNSDKTHRDGLSSKCKACIVIYNKQYRDSHRKQKPIDNRPDKLCKACLLTKVASAFYKANTPDGLNNRCIECCKSHIRIDRKSPGIEGQRFGRWVVLFEAPSQSQRRWRCQCDCGVQKDVLAFSLLSGDSTSCGCYLRENPYHTHWQHKSRTYRSWHSMLCRCRNPKTTYYERYGGRGITVCNKWNTFEGFYEDMGERPPKTSIERINNDLGYFKDNCRWASQKDQLNNKSNNRRIEYNGNSLTISQWSERTGISRGAIMYRLAHGWNTERILTTPVNKKYSHTKTIISKA